MSLETVKDVLLWTEAQFGSQEAIVEAPDGVRLTYAELNDRARRACAGYARDGAIEKGDRVSWLSLTPSANVTALSFGARKMGAIPVAINARAGAERVRWMIDNVGVKALAYSSDCADLMERVFALGVPSVRWFIALDDPCGLPGESAVLEVYETHEGAPEPACAISEEDVCLLLYTSGSTGRPKPIMHTEGSWSWLTMTLVYQLGLYFDDVSLNLAPPNFAGWAHLVGASLRAAAKQCCVRFDPATVLRVAAEERATHALLSPTLVRMLYEQYRQAPESVAENVMRAAVVGGERMTPEILDMLRALFPKLDRLASLGATEAITLHAGHRSEYLGSHHSVVGKPLPGMSVELRDEETGEIVDGAGTGVLYVKGPGVAAGVWGDPEATALAFPEGWWRTGDILSRDALGYYSFSGRSDHVFKSGNIKIQTEAVEEILKDHPAVLDAVVVPAPDAMLGQVAFAYIRNSEPLTVGEMVEWWRQRDAPGYSRPRHWRLQGDEPFPMVTAAKVDRVLLRQRADAELASLSELGRSASRGDGGDG